MRTSESIDQLATALSAAQGAMDGAKKGTVNPFFNHKYADLASVRDVLREPFATHGLSVVQFPQTTFSGEPAAFEWTAKRSWEVRYGVRVFTVVTVVTRLMHSSGQWIEDSVAAMLPNGDPQAVGSAITYLRRYALQAVAGIATEDDDAEGTTSKPPRHGGFGVRAEPNLVTDRLQPAAAHPGPAVVSVALVPIQHPEGYLAWLDAFRETATRGTAALEAGWFHAPKAFRLHLKTHAPDLVETLKAIAARTVAAPATQAVAR